MSPAAIVIAIFVLVLVGLVMLALRRPLLGRLALREAVRRPGQSILIVAGLMVGTTSIYAMQLLVDSAVQSDAQAAYRAWGHVDLIASDAGRFFDPSVASALSADGAVRKATSGVQAGIELQGSVIDVDRNNAKPLVLLVGFDPSTQEPFGQYDLRSGEATFGRELASGDVLLSPALADALQAQVGDRLKVAASPDQTAELRVAGIAKASGPGAYGLRPAVFAPLASLQLMTGGPEINVIRIAAAGEGSAELDRAHLAAIRVRNALLGLPGGGNIRVREAKRENVEAAIEDAAGFGTFYTALGMLIALAGATLVVILAVALAEERRPRHAVLRALGLKRTGLITLLVLEGGMYASIAALLAPIPGALLGVGILKSIAALYRTDPAGIWATQIQPGFEPSSVAGAIAVGGLLTIVTLIAASVRNSRMEIASAVKNLPDRPKARRRSRWQLAGTIAISLVAAAALFAATPVRLASGAVLILAAAWFAGPWLAPRVVFTLGGAALAIWTIAIVAAEIPLNTGVGFTTVALASPLAVFGLSLLLASNLRLLASTVGRLSGRAKAALVPSLAYVARRPLRAGLGVAAFGLVLTLTTILASVLPSIYNVNLKSLDEYDIRVSAPAHPGLTFPDSLRSRIVRDVSLPTLSYVGDVRIEANGLISNRPAEYLPLYTLTREQLLATPFQLAARDARYNSDADVWRALADDPSLVVSPNYTVLGGKLTLSGTDGPVHFRIAAAAGSLGLFGLVGSEAAMAPFRTLPVGSTILARTAPGEDARAVARDVQREVFRQGGDATTIKETLDGMAEAGQAVFGTMRLALGIGLLVGVLSLGILALRAAVERRRAIGTLRALGYQPRSVLAGILVEVLLTASTGALIGVGVGLVIAYLIERSIVGPANVGIDGSALAWTIGLMYAAVIAVTFGPALRAARLAPAEALRVVD